MEPWQRPVLQKGHTRHIRYDIALPPTCSTVEPISTSSKHFSVTRSWRQRWSIYIYRNIPNWVLSHRWINCWHHKTIRQRIIRKEVRMQELSELKVLMQRHIFGNDIANTFNPYSRAVFDRLRRCHTIHMGVHQYRCDDKACGHIHLQYHSCGDRHCPHCGGTKRDAWVEDRMSELLPIKYYHVVFTLPSELRSWWWAIEKWCLTCCLSRHIIPCWH